MSTGSGCFSCARGVALSGSVSVFTENVAIFLAAAQKTNISDILT
jgi:hypothetical protein